MIATKSRLLGMLVAVMGSLGLVAESSHAGGIISAGSSGTLYYGNRASTNYGYGAGTTVLVNASMPVILAIPATPPAPAYVAPVALAYVAPVYVPPVVPTYSMQFSAPPTPSVTLPPVATPNPTTQYDAFINFGTAPYADQALLTTGTAQSWTSSPSLLNAFGYTPSASELNDFSQGVLAKVQSTFADSGLSIRATTDPTASSAHMLSVVSGLSASTSTDAVGVTRVGSNGFDFIDKLGYANSPDQLEWAVAHNVAHELMHAFGGSHHTTAEGTNLDAARSDWSILVDPNTKFSSASVAEMTQNIRNGGLVAKYGIRAENLGFDVDGQELATHPVPEPATIALWGMIAGVAVLARRRINRRAA